MNATEIPPSDVSAPPANVIVALARVQAEVGGIGKKKGGEGGISYAFRGIDAIAAAAQPLLGRNGVVIVPEVREQRIEQISVASKPWTDTFVDVLWTIYGPGGVDDHITAYTTGWGRDNADKGINKAMTGAFKNLLLRILCIGDPQDDTDGHTHERDDRHYDPAVDENLVLYERVAATAGTPVAESLKELAAFHDRKLSAKAFAEDPEWRNSVLTVLDAVTEEAVPPPGVDAETGEILDVEQSAHIDLLMDALDSLEAHDELAIMIQQHAAKRRQELGVAVNRGLNREAFVADPDWADEVARLLLRS